MSRLQIAKVGIPILIAALLLSIPYTADNKAESVEHSLMVCLTSVCNEENGTAGSLCDYSPPRMSRIMIVRDGDTGTRSVIIKRSDTVCK